MSKATIIATSDTTAKEISKTVSGCFDEKSNFERELRCRFNTDQELKAIQFEFQGVILKVEKENAVQQNCGTA